MPSGVSTKRSGFIPQIQGLRTVALLLVATFHIWADRVSGGVDIFLMISAYLLTASLFRTGERGGPVRPLHYIVRKFARLLPLAAVVIVLTLVAAWFMLSHRNYDATIGDALASLFYYENFHLQAQQTDYYADKSLASLFQHFWSLSIQGQVFIVWPLLHWLTTMWARRSGKSLRGSLLIVFGAIFVGSLVWSIIATNTNQTHAYFDSFARLWEFAAGSLLALLPAGLTLTPLARGVLSWIGLFGVLSCGVLLPVASTFPGYTALWPVISAALIIITASQHPTRFGADRILAAPVLTTIGGYTYALYLVHWPVLVIYLNLNGGEHPGVWAGALLLAVSALLSFVLVRLVERPAARFARPSTAAISGSDTRVRPKPTIELRRSVVVTVVTLLVTVGATATAEVARRDEVRTAQDQLSQSTFASLGANSPDMPITETPIPDASVLAEQQIFNESPCPDYLIGKGSKEVCMERLDGDDRHVYLVGNSHTERFTNTIFEAAEISGTRMSVRSHAAPGCAFQFTPNPAEDDPCGQLWHVALEYIGDKQPDLVIVMGTLSVAGEPDKTFDDLPQWIEKVREVSPDTQVVAIRDTPRTDIVPYECAQSYGWEAEQCSFEYEPGDLTDYQSKLEAAGAIWVDLNHSICPDNVCRPQLGGLVTYLDTNHLTAPFMRSLTPAFSQQVSAKTHLWPDLG